MYDYSKFSDPDGAEAFMATMFLSAFATGIELRDMAEAFKQMARAAAFRTREFYERAGEPLPNCVEITADDPAGVTTFIEVALQNARALQLTPGDLMAAVTGWGDAMSWHAGTVDNVRRYGIPGTEPTSLKIGQIEVVEPETVH